MLLWEAHWATAGIREGQAAQEATSQESSRDTITMTTMLPANAKGTDTRTSLALLFAKTPGRRQAILFPHYKRTEKWQCQAS